MVAGWSVVFVVSSVESIRKCELILLVSVNIVVFSGVVTPTDVVI